MIYRIRQLDPEDDATIYFFYRDHMQNQFTPHMLRYMGYPGEINRVFGQSLPIEMPLDEDVIFFVDPSERPTIDILNMMWDLGEPTYSPFEDMPRPRQFAMYALPATSRRAMISFMRPFLTQEKGIAPLVDYPWAF